MTNATKETLGLSEENLALARKVTGWPLDATTSITLPKDALNRLLNAARASPLSEGEWVLVPREITLPMQHAYFGVIDKNLARVETDARFGRYSSQEEAYRAMLAASPSRPLLGGTDERDEPNPVQSEETVGLGEEDRAWLEAQKYTGHCGEENSEIRARHDHNERIDRILSALPVVGKP